MIPSVVTELSRQRSRKFHPTLGSISQDVWVKGQKLQEHIHIAGEKIYVFSNYVFVKEKHKAITKSLIEKHINASINSKSVSEYSKKRVFYIFNDENQECECETFWKFGYCKHYIAVQILNKKIKVIYLFIYLFLFLLDSTQV